MLTDTANQGVVPSESFMQNVVASCHSQEMADDEYYVPWSRHLLACLRRTLAVDFIVGTRAVVSNPHYKHFFSPIETDSSLGAVTDWQQQPALLLLDCFAPDDRHFGAGCKTWSHRVGSEIGPTILLGYVGYSKTTGITS
jgi:hypothetical protein